MLSGYQITSAAPPRRARSWPRIDRGPEKRDGPAAGPKRFPRPDRNSPSPRPSARRPHDLPRRALLHATSRLSRAPGVSVAPGRKRPGGRLVEHGPPPPRLRRQEAASLLFDDSPDRLARITFQQPPHVLTPTALQHPRDDQHAVLARVERLRFIFREQRLQAPWQRLRRQRRAPQPLDGRLVQQPLPQQFLDRAKAPRLHEAIRKK